jgi:chondroitin AC lyase
VVCLGSGITSTDAAPVFTTINQCLLNGPVTAQSHGQPATLRSADANLADADWVEHDGLRYVFPEPQAVTISDAPRTGNWHRVFNNPSSPSTDVTQDVFTLCIDHGSSPQAGSYEYCIVPADHADQPPVRIVANTEKVQAVQTSGHWCGAVFWTAGGVDLDGVSVAVDRPCVLMMDSVNGSPHVTLTDPTQKLEKITVTIGGHANLVELPRGGDAGKSIAVE